MEVKGILIALAVCVAGSAPAHATWSVVAVDAETGEVGIAGASCSTSVQLIAGVVPGAGVVASQAATSFVGRDRATAMMGDGKPAAAIIDALRDEELYASPFRAGLDRLQYGVATLRPSPTAGTLTGPSMPAEWGGEHGQAGQARESFAVQGNTLRPGVVDAMAARWRHDAAASCRRPMAERLLRTLESGRNTGGDARCPIAASSLAAFLIVAQPNDDPAAPSLRLDAPLRFSWPSMIWQMVAGYTPAAQVPEPVAHLRQLYDLSAPPGTCPD
ncbi:MAG: DUF1028 domain-containing protein [bacterium]|nr:DUF1028 domain-containing protein [bacterium]